MLHEGNTIVIPADLLATVCDISATAKLDGFVSYGLVENAQKSSYLKRVNFSRAEVGFLRPWHPQTKCFTGT